jgi:hypothetical protein
MNGTAVTNRLQNSFKITCTDHRIIEILGLRPSNRLPVSYYLSNPGIDETRYDRGSPSQNTVSSRNQKNTLTVFVFYLF